MNNNKRIHYVFAGASFLIAFLVYYMTMQPSIPFWDCGEFAGAAMNLQVPHPPGSPLWTIVGRLAMMLPTQADVVSRYNLFSVLASAVTIMLLYLTTARLIRMWRGEPKSMADMLTSYGGAFIAATAFTFTDSFWFNALECEVYAFGSLFIALIPWIMLVWYDHADEEHSEKYILLVAYIIGLSLGVHQLALLTIFPCFMLIYYRRRNDVTIISWLGMAAASVIAFFIAYKLVLSQLVNWLASTPFITVAILGGVVFGIWWSQKNKKAILNLSLWSALLLFMGYSTYTVIIVRANQNPPMNQNAPKSFAQLTRYINREQYGDRGMFPRRQKLEPGDESKPTFTKYTSDFEFFLKYQTDHMYNRYLFWNFIGRENDKQDAGTDWSKTWGIPFLLGLFGLFWHFKRDPKRALSFLALFIMIGWATAWYQNQQEPQPRERDYFYVGAFYVYAMWIGIGATGMMELLRGRRKRSENDDEENTATPVITGDGNTGLLGLALAAAIILVPVNLCVGLAGMATGQPFSKSSKWAEYSREKNYIPFDYAYNILQSCDMDAILFTYGDNDTFPLWCLQDVYGIRRDVRIVQLSLSNIGWYIDQVKNGEPWGAKKVPLSNPMFASDRLLVPESDPLAPRVSQDDARLVSVNVSAEAVRRITNNPNRDAAAMSWKYTGTYAQGEQNLYTVSDQLSLDIIQTNINTRPIYYSVTVPDNYRIGLSKNLVAEGMALRVTPDPQIEDRSGYGGPVNEERMQSYLFDAPPAAVSGPRRGMMIRTYSDPSARYSYLDREYALNYLLAYMKYSDWVLAKGKQAESNRALDTMERRLPPELIATDFYPADVIADLYQRSGNEAKTKKYAAIALDIFLKDANEEGGDPQRAIQKKYRLGVLYTLSGKYAEAEKVFKELKQSTGEKGMGPIEFKIMENDAKRLEAKGDKRAALDKFEEMLRVTGVPEEQLPQDFKPLVAKRDALKKALGVPDSQKR